MLTARQVVNELQKTGHSVAFIRRADGGIRIYNIDGVTFPRNSSEGNNAARDLLKKEAVMGKSQVPILKTDYSAKRLEQLKKNRQKKIQHPTTNKSPLQRALEEIRKTKKVIDQLVREGHGKASDFENLATTANQLLNTSDIKALRSERTRLYLYRQELRRTKGQPLVDPNEVKAEIVGMLYGAGMFDQYEKIKNKNTGYFYGITKQDLDELEKAYKAGSEDIEELFTTNERLAKLLR